ncbi:MAG TPA: hypothetical protein VHI13_11295 [Candidatus Kapabacteria bacterium]|nr:hypothetical protein [Candidatus Kapabacteria bacterium]
MKRGSNEGNSAGRKRGARGDAGTSGAVPPGSSAITVQYLWTQVVGLFVRVADMAEDVGDLEFRTALHYSMRESEQMEVTCEIVGATSADRAAGEDAIVLQSISTFAIDGLHGIPHADDGPPLLPAWAYSTLASVVVGVNRGIMLERLNDSAYRSCTLPIQSIEGLVPAGVADEIEHHGI